MRQRPRRKRKSYLIAGAAVLVICIAAIGTFDPFGLASQAGLPTAAALARSDALTQSGCQPNHPTFQYGFAELKTRLGPRMGEAIDCEHPIHVNGDTRQTTTTGYAYYRKGSNIPTFTDGWRHWALIEGGLVYWTGDVVDPPSPSPPA